jgi:YidC/Oxa1 family membrane protein insertase
MFSFIWHTIFFDPVYNSLVAFIDLVPGGDVGVAIILTTVLIKFILLPLSIKAAKTQKVMREIEPKLREIKEKYKGQREKQTQQAEEMMKIYKEAGMNPFSALFVFILQIPLVIALYLSVSGYSGVSLPDINLDVLYSFVAAPVEISMNFLGVLDMAGKSLPLAILAGITMFIQMKIVMPALPPREPGAAPDFKTDFSRNMQMQMKYVMPVIIVFAAYIISAAIALYFVVSNLFAIGQEFYIRRHR